MIPQEEDASSVGVRSHFIHPVLPEADGTTKNVFPCKVERVIEDDVFVYLDRIYEKKPGFA